jgi:hypothetical protein
VEIDKAFFLWKVSEKVAKSIPITAAREKRSLSENERHEIIWHTDLAARAQRRYFVLLSLGW